MMGMTGRKGEFTGWHMLAVMVAFFGVVIAVNLTMAVMARKSWTGMVVENTYVASQQFNARAAEGRAQAALGWSSDLAIEDGIVTYRLRDADGVALRPQAATAYFRHPAYDSADQQVALIPLPDGRLTAKVELGDGQWIVEVETEAGLDHPYRDPRRVTLRGGTIR